MRFTKRFDPKLVFFGHQVWDRVSYWGDSEFLRLTLPQLIESEYPVPVMMWGESHHYVP